MRTSCYYYFTYFKCVGHLFIIAVPFPAQCVRGNEKICRYFIAVFFHVIVVKFDMFRMSRTDTEHNVRCFVDQSEYLCVSAVVAIYKNIRCCGIDKRKAPALRHVQNTAGIVAYNSVERYKNPDVFNLLCQRIRCTAYI